MEWVRTQWGAAEAEAVRLQTELDSALAKLEKWEAKFAHVRKLLDGEKRERNIIMKKYNEQVTNIIFHNYFFLYTFLLLTFVSTVYRITILV